MKEKVITGGNLAHVEIEDDTFFKSREFTLYNNNLSSLGEPSSDEMLVNVLCYWSETYNSFKIQIEADLHSDLSPITILNSRQVFDKALDLIDQCDN